MAGLTDEQAKKLNEDFKAYWADYHKRHIEAGIPKLQVCLKCMLS